MRLTKADAAKRRKMIQSLVGASIVDKNGVEVHAVEKLRMAFALMEERGVIAEGRWWCCERCGKRNMQEVFETVPRGKPLPFGYCFFDDDDWVNYAVNRYEFLVLTFKSFAGSHKAVGMIVTDCLDSLGLEWKWDGSEDQEIQVCMGEDTGVNAKWRRSGRCVESMKGQT